MHHFGFALPVAVEAHAQLRAIRPVDQRVQGDRRDTAVLHGFLDAGGGQRIQRIVCLAQVAAAGTKAAGRDPGRQRDRPESDRR